LRAATVTACLSCVDAAGELRDAGCDVFDRHSAIEDDLFLIKCRHWACRCKFSALDA